MSGDSPDIPIPPPLLSSHSPSRYSNRSTNNSNSRSSSTTSPLQSYINRPNSSSFPSTGSRSTTTLPPPVWSNSIPTSTLLNQSTVNPYSAAGSGDRPYTTSSTTSAFYKRDDYDTRSSPRDLGFAYILDRERDREREKEKDRREREEYENRSRRDSFARGGFASSINTSTNGDRRFSAGYSPTTSIGVGAGPSTLLPPPVNRAIAPDPGSGSTSGSGAGSGASASASKRKRREDSEKPGDKDLDDR